MQSRLNLDTTNILLLLGSAALACWRPFETLLLAYAVLGPLHYLTEISWLHDRSFFTKSKPMVLFIIIGAVVAGLFALTEASFSVFEVEFSSSNLIGLLLVMAMIIVIPAAMSIRILMGIVLGAVALMYGSTAMGLLATTLLTTVIHVFVFTGLFMLLGARKSSSKLGYLAIAFLVLTPLVLIKIPVTWSATISDWAALTYIGFFEMLTRLFMGENGRNLYLSITQDPTAILVTRVLAFMYLHHYLNWFAKTSIIGWHRTATVRIWSILAVWIASVSLYFWDFQTGIMWLLMLSLGHVILEFPLNAVTMKSLFSKSGKNQ